MNKAQRRISKLLHDVYRAYDDQGQLLYVGLSVNVFRRLRQHAAEHSRWVPFAVRVYVEEFPDRWSGAVAEARAIRLEKPTWNVTPEAERAQFEKPASDAYTLLRLDGKWWIDG